MERFMRVRVWDVDRDDEYNSTVINCAGTAGAWDVGVFISLPKYYPQNEEGDVYTITDEEAELIYDIEVHVGDDETTKYFEYSVKARTLKEAVDYVYHLTDTQLNKYYEEYCERQRQWIKE